MIAVANIAVLFVLSLFPPDKKALDPHGLHNLARDPVVRTMLLEGRFDEFSALVDGFMGQRLSIDLSLAGGEVHPRNVQYALQARAEFTSLLSAVKGAIAVACLALELKALGPAKGMMAALDWVGSGLIRRSGLKAHHFPSFFQIVANPDRPRLMGDELWAIDRDLKGAQEQMDSTYENLLGQLAETLL